MSSSFALFDSYEEIIKPCLVRANRWYWSAILTVISLKRAGIRISKKTANIEILFQVEQRINKPTRVTKTTGTLIDQEFRDRQELVVDSGVGHFGISYHSLSSKTMTGMLSAEI